MGYRLILLALSVAAGGAGCSCDDRPKASSHAEGVIGAAGGSITSADGDLTVVVPPGALDDDVLFTIDPSGEEAPADAMSDAYEIGPSGTTFHEPVSLVFSYDPGALAGRPAHAMRVGSSVEGVWYCVPMNGVDDGAHEAIAAVMHLSSYVLHFLACGADRDCEPGEKCTAQSVCAIPCVDDADCPQPTQCLEGVCIRPHCRDAEGCTDALGACSIADGPGVCLADTCEGGAGGECGFYGLYEQSCTDELHCAFSDSCGPGGDVTCEDPEVCWRSWCIPGDTFGCDCAEAGCSCISGGDSDTDTDTDTNTDSDTDTDTDTGTDADVPVPYCAQPCVRADDCCGGGAGCASRGEFQFDCRDQHCWYAGCRVDADCPAGAGLLCYQRAGGWGECSVACPGGDGDCVDFGGGGYVCTTDVEAGDRGLPNGGLPFCALPSFDCAGDAECDPLTCSDGDCVCDIADLPVGHGQCNAQNAGWECVDWPCERVLDADLGGRGVGDPCEDNRDCDTGRCCAIVGEDCRATPELECTCLP